MNGRLVHRSVLALAILARCLAPAAAQDAAQVLRVSVCYGTLKNTPAVMAKLTPEARAEVDRLEKLARAANSGGNYGDALKHMYHAMAVMRGTEWTPARALESAVIVKLDRLMVDPGDSVAVKVGQMFPLDEKPLGKLAASISLFKLRGDDVIRELKTFDAVDPDFMTTPLSAEVAVPEVETGNYRIAVQLKPAAGEPIVKYKTIHIERGLAADFAAAKARAAKTEATMKAKRQDALLAMLPTAAYRISLFELGCAGEITFERVDFRDALKEANTMLDALEAGKDPLAARRGEFKKAYLSKVDNTVQPYQMFVPSSYDKSKPSPLVIALHGMGGDENSYLEAITGRARSRSKPRSAATSSRVRRAASPLRCTSATPRKT